MRCAFTRRNAAGLYLEAGLQRDEARELACRNLDHTRDRSAVELARAFSQPPAAPPCPALSALSPWAAETPESR